MATMITCDAFSTWRCIPYVLAVHPQNQIRLGLAEGLASLRMDQWFARKHRGRWHRLSAGWGAKGPRWFDWAWRTMEAEVPEGWQAWVVVRRSLSDPTERVYYRVCAPKQATLEGRGSDRAGQRGVWTGSVRGQELDGLVSAHHPLVGGPILCNADDGSGKCRARKKSLGAEARPEQLAALQVPERIGRWLIPYTLPEVLRLIWSLVWQHVEGIAHAVAWSFFRRHHQAVAQACHYQRRLAPNTS